VVRDIDQRLSKASLASPEPGLKGALSYSAPTSGVFLKSYYYGPSHWIHSVLHFERLLNVLLSNEADPTSAVYHGMQKCKSTARQIKARERVLPAVVPHISHYIPAREMADKLVRSYLETLEMIFPVLHVPSFIQWYEGFWLDSTMATDAFITKLLLVLAIGAIFQPLDEATALRVPAKQWIYAAHTYISLPYDKYRLNIDGVQIHCLLLLARLIHDLDGDHMAVSAGQLLRMAMQIGLHVDVESHTAFTLPDFQLQLRRKLWATVLEIVAQTSMDSGTPPLIQSNDYTCKPPLNADEDVDKVNRNEFCTVVKSQDQFTQSSMQIMLTRSLQLRLEITAYVNNPQPNSTKYEQTIRLSEELLKHCGTNSALIQSFKLCSSQPTQFHVNAVELLTHRYLFALHYPYALMAKSEPAFYYSRKICMESSLLILSQADTGDTATKQLRLWGGGHLFSGQLQATAFLMDEMLHQIETDTTDSSPNIALTERTKDMRKYIQDAADLQLLRLRHGRTNVRGHVVITAQLAQIDARLNGSPVEPSMKAAAEHSLVICYDLLQMYLAQLSSVSPSAGPDYDTPQTDPSTGDASTTPLPSDNTVSWE
jgi:hypothetical protein